MGAPFVDELFRNKIIIDDSSTKSREKKSFWDIQRISNEMKLNEIK